MKNNFCRFFSFLFFAFLISGFYSCKKKEGCDKYPDGCNKLMRDWEIEALTINGVDSLSRFMSYNCYCTTYRFEWLTNNYYFTASGCNGNPPSYEYWGDWYFWETGMDFTFNYSNKHYPFFWINSDNYWKIITLTNDKLWVNQTYNDTIYEIHFKAK